MIFWCWGMVLFPFECIKIKSSRGLSKDFMFNNLIGFTLMAFQDMYGFLYSGASYGSEIHISDVILSFCGAHFGYIGTIIVYVIPTDVPNNLTWMSKVPSTISVILFIVWWCVFGSEGAAITGGTCKAILS